MLPNIGVSIATNDTIWRKQSKKDQSGGVNIDNRVMQC